MAEEEDRNVSDVTLNQRTTFHSTGRGWREKDEKNITEGPNVTVGEEGRRER